ncbi:LysR family transcriptional regulator [Lacibacterium aquatile]|uniref:LysR family transcriptional regulator n=1 Tax=Lacibacterium aquatile TaxID=1168082 RepID=A0ABW5DTP4_9PROT
MNGPDWPKLDWNDLQIFLGLVRGGSVSAAAASLHVSEATVVRHLVALEEALGARLFDRLPNRLVLTEFGSEIAALARSMDSSARDLALFAKDRTLRRQDDIRITATTSVALFLARHMAILRAAAPTARIDIINTRSQLDIAKDETDIALRMRKPPEKGDYTVRRIGRISFSLYASHRYLETRGDAAPEIIGVRSDGTSGQAKWLERVTASQPPALWLGEVPLRLEAARADQGAALLPCFIGDGDVKLSRLMPPPTELGEDVYLLLPHNRRDRPRVRAIADALGTLFKAETAHLSGETR